MALCIRYSRVGAMSTQHSWQSSPFSSSVRWTSHSSSTSKTVLLSGWSDIVIVIELQYTCKNKIKCEFKYPLCRCSWTGTSLPAWRFRYTMEEDGWGQKWISDSWKSAKIALPRWVCVHFSGMWRSRMQKMTSEIEFSVNFESTHVVPTFSEIKK